MYFTDVLLQLHVSVLCVEVNQHSLSARCVIKRAWSLTGPGCPVTAEAVTTEYMDIEIDKIIRQGL